MERTEVLDLMGQLRLFGMKNVYDEILEIGRASCRERV